MAIEERVIVEAVAGMALAGNEEGLIPAFALYLTNHCADFYNRISFGVLGALVRESPELTEDAALLLTEAAHVCAFHTFGGIMASVEWDALVQPMIESREDWVFGMVAVVNALGWGRYRVAELVPGERLVVELSDGYESSGFLESYPRADGPRCFLANGGMAGLMNLVYQGDITRRPTLTEEFYREVFGHPRSFRSRERLCAAKGDSRCEFVVERMQG